MILCAASKNNEIIVGTADHALYSINVASALKSTQKSHRSKNNKARGGKNMRPIQVKILSNDINYICLKHFGLTTSYNCR
jgi:hypothetical protein